MTRQPRQGIHGVLDGLLSRATPDPRIESEPMQHLRACDARDSGPLPTVTGARRGRPPGLQRPTVVPKEKVTFRISRDLIAAYRDWSWEARCQISELVERALAHFRQSRHH